jgi:hypothetical protein
MSKGDGNSDLLDTKALEEGLRRFDAARPDMARWGFDGDGLNWPSAGGGRLDAPSLSLLLWVWEHLGALLRTVQRLELVLQQAEATRRALEEALQAATEAGPEEHHAARHLGIAVRAARAEGAFDVASTVALQLGLHVAHAERDKLPRRVRDKLARVVREAAAFRALRDEAQSAVQEGETLASVEDQAGRCASTLCEQRADYDEGYRDALYVPSVAPVLGTAEGQPGQQATPDVQVMSRWAGAPALTVHGSTYGDEPEGFARAMAESIVQAGPLLWVLTRILGKLRASP